MMLEGAAILIYIGKMIVAGSWPGFGSSSFLRKGKRPSVERLRHLRKSSPSRNFSPRVVSVPFRCGTRLTEANNFDG